MTRLLYPSLVLALIALPAVHAAPIAWSSETFTTHGPSDGQLDTGIIDKTGIQVLAENTGGSALTFDGINFAAGTISFGASFGGFFDSSSPLAASGTYGGDSSGATVSLGGLTIGDQYRIQVLLFDGRSGAYGSSVKMDDISMGVYGNGLANVTWGSGLLITGTFTADATSQSFNLKGNYGTAAGFSVNNMMNAVLLHVLNPASVTRLVNVGGNAHFSAASLSTDEPSYFRLGGPVRDRATITASGGLAVTAGSAPRHIINITQVGPVTIGNYPLISYSGAIGGLGFGGLQLGPLGILKGRLVNNVANSSIDLEITEDGTYANWEDLKGIPGDGPAADSDGDGIPNGIDFVTGGAYGTASPAELPQGIADGSVFTFSYPRNAAAAATASLFVEISEDLANWTPAQDGVDGVTMITEDDYFGEGVDRVLADFPIAETAGPGLFARLRADIPEGVQTIVDNSGSVPNAVTTLDPRSITTLMADDAKGASALTANNPAPKRIWLEGWQSIEQVLTWQVFAPVEGRYEVTLISTGIPAVRVTGGMDGPLNAAIADLGWNRNLLGEIRLPQGTSTLRLELAANLGSAGSLRSLDVLPVAAKDDYQQRVASLRADTSWIRQKGYGVMLQYGAWGYPENGDRNPWEQVAGDFDVAEFARMVDEDMGAKWVIWSITWRGSHFPMPLATVDAIVPDHTIQRDLMADLAAALKSRGIKMMFYYHPGHEDAAWWAANWQDPYHKKRFIDNWIAVMTEIGNRYGEDLAGWFFDDGVCYSPAPFEAMTRAAKSGFPGRLVSYNNWILPILTDFQDVQMGEGFTGSAETEVGSNGIYEGGPHEGLQAHGMFCVNSYEWGIWRPNTVTPLNVNADMAIGIVKNANRRGQAMSLNFDMYEDGTVTPETLDMFRQLKAAIYAPVPVSEGKPATDSGHWPGNYGADQAVDGVPSTLWSLPQNETSGWIEVDLGVPTEITSARLHEVVTPPRVPLVTGFAIEAKQGDGSWQTIITGNGMGANLDLAFAPVTAQVFRLRILDASFPNNSSVTIGEFQLFE